MEDENKAVSVWQRLKEAEKPIVMYGMGDGAEKIMAVMNRLDIKPKEFMASDEFVRGHSFLGYQVRKLSEIEEMYDDFIIVVCFGSSLPPVMNRLYELAEKYELYAPDVPVVGDGLFDESYIEEHSDRLKKVRKLLADDKSREVFDGLIAYKLSGDINKLREFETPLEEAEELLKIGKSETYVDLGAYNGDTVDRFLRLTNKEFAEIYAVEPDFRNFSKMVRRNYALGRGIFHPINAAAWNENTQLQFRRSGGRNSSACNQYGRGAAVKVNGIKVDSMLGDKKPTLIKIDVEGAEREALDGARECISKHRPRIVLSVYHRTEDLIELPLKIKELNGGYKLYLRHHPYIPAWDTNLYCI
ncbi:MAG: FkbM family methyltransferase [Ruminococcaceae bacterium]|nr:FkbM family methyltransferase [Oscillospiraceae bacterium]